MTKIEIDTTKARYHADCELVFDAGDGIAASILLDEETAKLLRDKITRDVLGQDIPEDWK